MKLYAVKIEYTRFRTEAFLTTRDLRALVLRFIDKNSEYYPLFDWHERGVPRVIYSKPRNGFAIVYTTLKDATDYLLSRIEKRFVILRNKRIAVKYARRFDIEWSVKKINSLYMYRTRTDIITGVNNPEWHINTAVKNRGTIENLESDVLGNIITRTVKYNYKEWFGFEPDLSDLKIKILDGKHIIDYNYKSGTSFPAWNGFFFSNYSLPPFIGYKVGLGKGEIEKKAVLERSKAEKLLAV